MVSRVRHGWCAAVRTVWVVALGLVIASGTQLAAGQPVRVPVRIVSTSPSITETLFALGLGDRVVGVSTYCRYPVEVARLPKVGTFLQPDAELIVRLAPDLVLVHPTSSTITSKLKALGVRHAVVDQGTSPSVFAAIRQVGAVAGVSEHADAVVRDLEQQLAAVRTAVAPRPPRRVLVIVGRRTGTLTDIVAVGASSYLSEIVTLAGGVNVLADAAVAYPRVSMETIIKLAPDVIVDVGEMGESPSDSERRRLATEALWHGQTLVKAVRDSAVHVTHDEAFVVPGPRIVSVARAMARWFHGVALTPASRAGQR